MKTTDLIRHWTMNGAGRDIAERLRSGSDIREAFSSLGRESEPMPERGGLLVKQADADDWTPLAATS